MGPLDKGPLAGLRVLVVEDHYLIAEDMRRLVLEMGGAVVGPTASLAVAIGLLTEHVDFALLDVTLDGTDVYPLARELTDRQIPFIFVTGYEPGSILEAFRDAPHVGKPASAQALAACIRDLRLATDGSGRL
jgi:CheY-like chemotaxis protein